MQLMHPGLKDLLLIDKHTPEKSMGFLSLETPLPELFKKLTTLFPYKVGLQIRREYRHIAMGWRALKIKNQADVIFVFEIYLQHLSLLLPLLAIAGKETYLCLHGEQQFAQRSVIKRMGLAYLKAYLNIVKKAKIVLFEIDDQILPDQVRIASDFKKIIPHPLRSEITPRLKPGERLEDDEKIKIGIVGMIRPDKPIFKLVEKLKHYTNQHPNTCELIVGLPFWQKSEQIEQLNVTLYDTTHDADYLKLLNQLDILVAFYEGEQYYFRASGVLNEAISSGCYVIASDQPVIKHQVTWPTEVGRVFSSFDQLELLLNEAVLQVRQQGQDKHWQWREQRSAEAIATILFSDSANEATPNCSEPA